ncbi:metallophosphoesterase [Sphingomonas qilianensis]|uniref:Metallophosphoesterase n=1 Tax=Sphingomonas qilianensis TaxID=1736690 RepID=A0ABU9XR82_9SPHN
MRKLLIVIVSLLFVGLLAFWLGLSNARRAPIVRTARIALADWPRGAAPVRVLLMSDIHSGSMAMDAQRLHGIVDQVRAQRPDLILLAGDFIFGHDAATARAVAPGLARELGRLSAPLGVIAVLGNHDYDTDPVVVSRLLATAQITELTNRAVQRGPLVIGGISDEVTAHASPNATFRSMERFAGARILLSHAPGVASWMRRSGEPLFAGHTHCGQIVLGALGPLSTLTERQDLLLCGVARVRRRLLIVTGGLGTSIVPVRFGAPPDLWVVTLGPATRRG